MAKAPSTGMPAFPVPRETSGHKAGMTIREWYAGQALTGILANPQFSDVGLPTVAETAFFLADAMLDRAKATA